MDFFGAVDGESVRGYAILTQFFDQWKGKMRAAHMKEFFRSKGG